MNDYLVNRENDFYKLQQTFNSGKKQILRDRYIVLTDIYFLLFDPVPDLKHCGKLLFWGDIRQLISSKGSDSSDHLILEWKNQDKSLVSFELVFASVTISEFLESALRRVNKLKDSFMIFHDELTKPNNEKKGYDYEKLVLLIQFKEEMLEKQQSINTVRELMSLYQNVIEVLSERNDEMYLGYLKKLKVLLENEEYQKQLAESKVERSGFQLSGSYYSIPHEEDKIVKLEK